MSAFSIEEGNSLIIPKGKGKPVEIGLYDPIIEDQDPFYFLYWKASSKRTISGLKLFVQVQEKVPFFSSNDRAFQIFSN